MDQPSSSKNMGWMYEGTKSLVNREDYLLGKKIDKNFELYSDVVVKDKEEDEKQEFFKQSLVESDHGTANHKISALDTRIVRNEDPLVALKFQEAQRQQQMLENPLLKLKAQRVLRKAFERELKKEMTKKHKQKHQSRSSSSSSDEEGKTRRMSQRSERRGSDTGTENGRHEGKRRRLSTRSRSRSRDQERRKSSRNEGHHRRHHSSGMDERHEHREYDRRSERRGNGRRSRSREEGRRNEREEPKQKDERKSHHHQQQTSSSSTKRPKLTAQEMEERRKAMMANANWRDEQREQNVAMAAEKLRKEEADAQRNMGPSFIKPLLDTASTTSSLEKRLQSNRMNIQRTHEHMDKSFARK